MFCHTCACALTALQWTNPGLQVELYHLITIKLNAQLHLIPYFNIIAQTFVTLLSGSSWVYICIVYTEIIRKGHLSNHEIQKSGHPWAEQSFEHHMMNEWTPYSIQCSSSSSWGLKIPTGGDCMSWLPHMIFHCHQRRDSITRDAKETKQLSICVCVCVCV